MTSEVLKILTKDYARLRNQGLENKSSITNWEYNWVNLSFPDGYKSDEDNFTPVNRRDKVLCLKDYQKLADY